MNINPVNNLNTNQNNSRQNLKTNPNFTSVIPAIILKDGVLVKDPSAFRRAIRALFKDLMSPSLRGQWLRSELKKYDKEINFDLNDHGKIIREVHGKKYMKNGIFYIFTGSYAESLDEIGRTSPFSKTNAKYYFDKAKMFIRSKAAHIGHCYDSENYTYCDNKFGLRILVKEIPTERGSIIVFDDFEFRSIKKTTTPSPNSVTKPAPNSVTPPPKNVNNTATAVKDKPNDGIITDFPQGVKREKPTGSQIYFNF